jgi:hypothetical protein
VGVNQTYNKKEKENIELTNYEKENPIDLFS